MRDQPPSDGEADIAFACSQSSPGPSLNLEWNKITKTQAPDPVHVINDVVGVPSFRIRHPVTTDSIALGGDSLTWGAFGWIRCALLVTVQGDWSVSPRMVLLAGRTTNCELYILGQTIETPMNPMRVWREIRLQVAESHLSFDACILSAAGGIGVRGMRDRRQLEASRQRFQIVPGKGTKIHAGLALSVSSQELQATTVFAGR